MEHRSALTNELNGIFRGRDSATWLRLLEDADIICAPVADYTEVTTSEQMQESGLLVSTKHSTAGDVVMPGFAIGGRPMTVRMPPPTLGEHNGLLRREMEAPAISGDASDRSAVLKD
jgi:crotonobetainyl-CoA:carnitine CoA-transferase CaiB-like acyl-CoA transferase